MATRDAANILAQVKIAIRQPYAWPGGYPRYILMADGEAIDVQSARENWRSIVWATITQFRDDWKAYGVDVNWGDSELFCAHSGRKIESAYGDE